MGRSGRILRQVAVVGTTIITGEGLIPTNYVFVSKATGDDATATLNDKTKPYLTLKTASDYAYTQIVAGKHTVVRVLDGVYDENRLNPAQAYYEFDDDTYVLSSTGGNYPIFGDTDGTDRILSVSGLGTFIKLNYHPGNDRQALCFSRAGSNILKFEAKEIDGVQLYGTYNKPLALANMYHRFRVDHHDNQTITFNNVWFKTHLQLASFKGKLTTLRFNDCTAEIKALHSDLYPIYNNAGTLIGTCADSYGVNSVDTSVLTQQQVVDTETLNICRNIAGIDFAQVVNTDTFNVIISNMRLIIYKTNCIGVKVTQRVEKAVGQTQNFRIEGLKIEDRTAGLTVIPYSATKTNTLTTDYRISLIDATINDKAFVNVATTNASYLDVVVNTGANEKLNASDYIIQLVTADGGATITGNNTSLDYQGVIPKTINVLFPATLTSFTETSTINIAGTGAIVVTGELGFPISKADIVLDRVYSMLYNSARNKFEVQGVSSMLILESELMSSSIAPFLNIFYTGATFVNDGANASAISPGCRKIVSAAGVNSGVFFGSELDAIRLSKDSMHKSLIKPLTLTNGITRIGALDDPITPLNGVYLEINHTTGVMSFVTKNSTTGTTTNVLGITASVKFYKVFTQIKATTVEVTITDNTLAVLATSSISTNIPYGKAMGTGIGSISLTGVKDMLSIDYHGYTQNTLR